MGLNWLFSAIRLTDYETYIRGRGGLPMLKSITGIAKLGDFPKINLNQNNSWSKELKHLILFVIWNQSISDIL